MEKDTGKVTDSIRGGPCIDIYMKLLEQQRRADAGFSLEQCQMIMGTPAFSLANEEWGRHNYMECIGCESQEGRREKSVVDVFVLGQS